MTDKDYIIIIRHKAGKFYDIGHNGSMWTAVYPEIFEPVEDAQYLNQMEKVRLSNDYSPAPFRDMAARAIDWLDGYTIFKQPDIITEPAPEGIVY